MITVRPIRDRSRQSAAETPSSILDALPANIAVLDEAGVIVSTNAAWRDFGLKNEARHGGNLGQNYLSVCDGVCGLERSDALAVAAGIRAVLSGSTERFSFEYRCDSPTERRWFLLTVAPLREEGLSGAVAMHMDITARKQGEEEVRRFAAAMDTWPDAIFMVDRESLRTVHVNDAACQLHGSSRERLLRSRPPSEVYGHSREITERTYDTLIAGRTLETEELQWSRNGAEPIWIEIRRHALTIGGRWTIVVQVRDVTERKQAQSRIAYLNRIYALLHGINALIVRVGECGELFRETCRIAVADGALAMAWIGIVDPVQDRLQEVASSGMDEEFLIAIRQRLASNTLSSPGNSLPTQVAASKEIFVSNDSPNDPRVSLPEMHVKCGIRSIAILPLLAGGKAPGVLVLYARESGFFHEEQMQLLTELAGDVAFAMHHIERQERLDYLAYYDDLTGVANRQLFLERVSLYVRNGVAAHQSLAVCFIDLERFKNINDSLGRPAGDALLKQVARWLTQELGEVNIARIDADRFAAVLPIVADAEEVAHVLERTMLAFANHSFRLDDASYRMAFKVGVAMCPDDGIEVNLLFGNAEAALKKAKVGGDRYLFYAQKMTETVVGRLNLENQLRQALELDQFVLHYQPKLDVRDGRLVGVEALIRWNDPRTGLVPPGRFIPILEETGLIHDVGRWALNQAVKDYLCWRNAGLPVVRIAVNLSPLQLRSREFIADIQTLLLQDANAAAGLELELTESLIMQDVKLSIASLEALRAMGVRIAIDDFGTGFSSLSYLSKLPVDTVKIDRSFVVNMLDGSQGHTLVSIIINLAHALKLRVVAEGVETKEQAEALRALNCDEMQGFLISPALPAALFKTRYLDGVITPQASLLP